VTSLVILKKGQDKADREIVTFPDGGVTIGVEQTN
jgi:hypothetical protein